MLPQLHLRSHRIDRYVARLRHQNAVVMRGKCSHAIWRREDVYKRQEYKQSERLALHRQIADAIFQKGLAYRDFTPAHTGDSERSGATQTWLFNPGMRELSRAESDRRAAAGESFALRFRVPRGSGGQVRFTDAVYGEQIKLDDDIEDFALLRSDGMPTYHLASCADDIDLRISHIIRGQDHLSNTYKHVLIFEAAGAKPPQFAHLPLLVAPDEMCIRDSASSWPAQFR